MRWKGGTVGKGNNMRQLRTVGVAVVSVVFVALFSGCAAVQRGTTQVKWEPGQVSSRTIGAAESGKYALYQGSDYKPKIIVEVRRDEKIGFEKAGANRVTAVAGSYHEDFDSGNYYYWNYRGK